MVMEIGMDIALLKMDNQQGEDNQTAQEAPLSLIWQPGGEGSLGENGYIYIWLSPSPVHPKLSHNIVNQLYSNIKKFCFLKKKNKPQALS